MRISELEEALQESVGITSEKERIIEDHKQMVQQMTDQIAELLRSSDILAGQRVLKDTQNKLADTQRLLEEEQDRSQRQILNLKYLSYIFIELNKRVRS